MALEVETRDCTALSDSDVSEMADICADGTAGYDVGILSKHSGEWVLITRVYEGPKLAGFAFCTLERIGGTPCVLIGLASVKRGSRRDAALRLLIGDQLRRAVLAFPDEDVLVGTRLLDAAGFAAFEGLADIVPRPGHKASGEERAWGRRLAKRFGAEGRINDRTFVVTGLGDVPGALDHEAANPATIHPEVTAFVSELEPSRGDALIAFGWAMAEDLAARASR
ncbi:MAG: hypothetical protein QOG43_1497 [Actinomycetota bacterium]|jgi:hypothetical protein|nr:hypothetical protein [Actinomycetota bacterium]